MLDFCTCDLCASKDPADDGPEVDIFQRETFFKIVENYEERGFVAQPGSMICKNLVWWKSRT